MGVPVEVGHSAYDLVGETVDLSETGARVAVDALGLEPEPGSSVDVIVSLEDGDVKTRGEVVRLQSRGSKWVLSIRFLNLAEKDADRIRRRVFQALREERARESD
jgi:c-di-GMP-binding flagellar brake protein YcgR